MAEKDFFSLVSWGRTYSAYDADHPTNHARTPPEQRAVTFFGSQTIRLGGLDTICGSGFVIQLCKALYMGAK